MTWFIILILNELQILTNLEVLLVQLLHRVIHCSGRKSHISQRRVHAVGRRHKGTIGHKYVWRVPNLIVFV